MLLAVTTTRDETRILAASASPARSLQSRMWALAEVRWAATALALFALGGTAHLAGAPAPLWWALYLACYVAGGWEPALSGLRALRERTLDVDLLMIVAAVGAAAIGQVFDGALLIVIFATFRGVGGVRDGAYRRFRPGAARPDSRAGHPHRRRA
jgi:cation transport ATPase